MSEVSIHDKRYVVFDAEGNADWFSLEWGFAQCWMRRVMMPKLKFIVTINVN